ncbi:porin family protein [Hymenobacter rubidus]|uniref:porin family protein n=1 Tax=Hymenobacter rubidus TaxID=1441626 RepID=UPI00191DC628|nr:porin family protein [Hymenobacter rubidus]
MKKSLLFLLALAASITTATAQVEIGLKITPAITSLRAESSTVNAFATDGSKLSLGGGLVVDYFFGENYAFSTGLLLTGKGGSYTYRDPSLSGLAISQKLTMQYLALPITVKLFTNEVAPATRLYFQVGGSLNVPIGSRVNDSKYYIDPATGAENKASEYVYFIDADALASVGVEYQLGKSTKVFAGVCYNRGLVDIDHYFERKRDFKDVTIKNSGFGLDLGMKF